MSRLHGFGELRASAFEIPAGTWWWLRDEDTRFSVDRPGHPWILHVDFSPRLAFAHACPRSKSPPRKGDLFLEHPAHPLKHEDRCQLDADARVYILPRQIKANWIDNGKLSCTEPSAEFLKQVQSAVGRGSS